MRTGRMLLAAAAAVCGLAVMAAGAAERRPYQSEAKVVVGHHAPCNLFDIDEPVAFPLAIEGVKPGAVGEIVVSVAGYDGKVIRHWEVPFVADEAGKAAARFEMGKPGTGYYSATYAIHPANDFPGREIVRASFGVAPFVDRDAKTVRDGGYAFGLKSFVMNAKKIHWTKDWRWNLDEVVDATRKLGLQWTRHIFNEKDNPENPASIGSVELVTRHPMNVVYKIERFPAELFDAGRYGALEEWEAKFGRGQWTLKTLPRKDDYQKWLAAELALIPPEQQVFEIWNEPWDKMSPEDFATLSQWIAEVVRRQRPGALLGPNLRGNTSPYQYDARVIDAGGMKGMDLVALHPYGNSEDRAWLRGYQKWINERAGRDIGLYVTEFGSHSTPAGPARRSEHEQAERVARQALALYAEGVKVITPHWMGQREENPTYIEDWFGFYRLNSQPKPVLMAYANAAARVDGSKYLGDLWYGPGVDAMLFERDGERTLALFTRGEAKKIDVPADAEFLRFYAPDGKMKPVRVGGEHVMSVEVGPAPVYIAGVGPALAAAASKELRPDRWPRPEVYVPGKREIPKLDGASLTFDGDFAAWEKGFQVAMLNPKVAGLDASGAAYLGWDENFLYVGVKMRDNEMLNKQPTAKLYRQDSVELFQSAVARDPDPANPTDRSPGYGPTDRQFFLTPTAADGKPFFGLVSDREMGILTPVENGRFFGGAVTDGWAVQAAVPWPAGFKPTPGSVGALEIRVNDADSSHERFLIDPMDIEVQVENPISWTRLVLK